MDYQGFTDDSLIMMYEGVREALAADDALRQLGVEVRFRVRETPAWKLHAADLEAEMLRRLITFEVIKWYEADQPAEADHPVQEVHGVPAVPEQSPLSPQAEPSISQRILASLSTIDILKR